VRGGVRAWVCVGGAHECVLCVCVRKRACSDNGHFIDKCWCSYNTHSIAYTASVEVLLCSTKSEHHQSCATAVRTRARRLDCQSRGGQVTGHYRPALTTGYQTANRSLSNYPHKFLSSSVHGCTLTRSHFTIIAINGVITCFYFGDYGSDSTFPDRSAWQFVWLLGGHKYSSRSFVVSKYKLMK
jgi:hypothetical protein